MSFLPSVPSPPLSLMAVDADSSTVSLVWFPPTEPNGVLLFYRMVARQVGSNRGEIVVSITANTSTSDMKSDLLMANATEDLSTANDFVSFTLTGLSPHTVYVITVQANTSAGYGNRSEELHIRTDPGECVCVACVCVCVCVCVRACVCVCTCLTYLPHSIYRSRYSPHCGTSSCGPHGDGCGSTCHSGINGIAMSQVEKEEHCPCGWNPGQR